MILDITREDIKELLEIRILEKAGLSDKIEELNKDSEYASINLDEPVFGKQLRYYIYVEIHAIFMAEISKLLDQSISLLSNKQVIILHGSVFNTIVNHHIDKFISNKAYYDLDKLTNNIFECLLNIQQDINYITVWA